MTDLPERIEMPIVIFAGPVSQNQIETGEFEDGDWDTSGETITYAEYATRYLRADTAIPKAEAERERAAVYQAGVEHGKAEVDAMVAAAYEACGQMFQRRGDEGKGAPYMALSRCRALTPADARAAFEQAVREAVEAEGARCAAIADRYHRRAMERADAARNEVDAWRHEECASTSGSIAAAIRAPQEPNE